MSQESRKPLVVIAGRPNVGKSTLFNRIIGRRMAITEGRPGITRDRLYAEAEWDGRAFVVVDTGGLVPEGIADPLDGFVRAQAEVALASAAAIVLVVDGKAGLTPADEEVAGRLRRTGRPVLLAVNKVEGKHGLSLAGEFYRLGLGDPIAISAEHGIGVDDLLDRVLTHLDHAPAWEPPSTERPVRVAIVGRPNVGKSSLVNRIVGEERMIASPLPGTTRDAIDITWEVDGERFVLVDTAGLRKRGKIEDSLERWGAVRTRKAIDRADVALILLDATEMVTEQDKKVAGYCHERGKAAIFVVNKWDLIEKDTFTIQGYEAKVREELAFMDYAPIVFISAKSGQRVNRLPDLIRQVAAAHRREVPTAQINRVLQDATGVHQPPTVRGKRLKIYYGTQVATRPPKFLLFVNDEDIVHHTYLRYLDNRLREAFDFKGTPLQIELRNRRPRAADLERVH